MYRTYKTTDEEQGKIIRQRWDGDIYYYDVFDSQEEADAEELRLKKLDEERERLHQEYLSYLRSQDNQSNLS